MISPTQNKVLLVAGVFLLGFVAAHAQELVKRGKYEVGPQIVMTMNRTLADGRKVILIPETVPVLTLKDPDGLHSAPLPDGSKLLCRELFGYRNSNREVRLAFACGMDTFETEDIGFLPRKGIEKYEGMKQ